MGQLDHHFICTPVADVGIGPNPSDLLPSIAFRIFPIAHQYELQMILKWCHQAAQRESMILWPPASIATDAVPLQPGMVQWLALADQRHCEELVGSCVAQLTSSDGDIMRQALVSRHLGPMVDGLSSETKSDIIWRLAGLPQSLMVGLPQSNC